MLRSSNFSSITKMHKDAVALATLHLVNPVIRPSRGVFVPRAISINGATLGWREMGPLLRRRYSPYRSGIEEDLVGSLLYIPFTFSYGSIRPGSKQSDIGQLSEMALLLFSDLENFPSSLIACCEITQHRNESQHIYFFVGVSI